MLFAKYLIFSSMVLGAQLSLYPTQQFLFVGISATAKIPCSSKEKLEGGGISVYWYRRREGEGPTCIKKCLNDQNVSKFACKPETHGMTLEIYNVQQNESGDYYCAVKTSSYLIFGNGSTLIVGDSYTTSSWVLLLVPSPHGLISTGMVDLACIVHGVSNPVQIFWNISGDRQEQALMRSLKAKDGSLMLISHISIPKDTWTNVKIFTCEVKFNSSGSRVKKSARYFELHPSGCVPQILHHVVAVFLVGLMVSLSLAWIRCCSSPGSKGLCPSEVSVKESQPDQDAVADGREKS
ncbi:immunoglobulin kappa light chain-like isoform X2 [Trachemys scripta elegans]|uniref:immunoglobulin kappa light chain-like isoform X2 n=1 Tax=Trachemys scripta elegans TaxID=31138 RepID=UPI001555D34A|nr:immunoglobulin kappa light chain-like isoform X2 [Trachemys scripta elegans]